MKSNKDKKYIIIVAVLCILLICIIIASFSIGRFSGVDAETTLRILSNRIIGIGSETWTSTQEMVVMHLRLPRIIACVLIGASLAISGVAYQALFGNPVASPDTLGVSNAASFAAVMSIVLGVGPVITKMIAFLVGTVTVMVVFGLAVTVMKKRNMITNLLLIGMVISSIFSALISVIKYIADPDDQLPQVTYWLMGSLSKITMEDLKIFFFFSLAGALPLFLLRWRMNILSLSDAEISTIGENVTLLRAILIICATLLTASSTAMTGGISWIGLFIPHIVRLIVGNDFKKVVPISCLFGAIFLLIMDNLARCVSINELPISILTSLVGAPIFFVSLVLNRRVIRE